MVEGGRVTTVAAIHIHPVKSCRRVELDRAVVGPYGLSGDREWQVEGPEGQMMNQRKFPHLARVQPSLIPNGLRLQAEGMPDLEVARPERSDHETNTFFGRVPVGDAGDEAAEWFKRLLGISCRLSAIASGYQRRVVVGTDLNDQEVSLADAAPLHLVSMASYEFLLDRAKEPFGIERFRPNLVVDGTPPWAEDTWRRISVGETEIHVTLPWPRCTIPQVDQETGERHREPAVVLKKYRWCSDASSLPEAIQPLVAGNALFGVGAAVGPEGASVQVGDKVEVQETDKPPLLPPD